MAGVGTREFCQKCPFFDYKLGWRNPDDSYWKEHLSECACQKCVFRKECEDKGPKSLIDCLMGAIALKKKLKPNEMAKVEEILKRKLG
jgi:hypothetical protein